MGKDQGLEQREPLRNNNEFGPEIAKPDWPASMCPSCGADRKWVKGTAGWTMKCPDCGSEE